MIETIERRRITLGILIERLFTFGSDRAFISKTNKTLNALSERARRFPDAEDLE